MSSTSQLTTFMDTDLAWAAGIIDGEGSICLIRIKRKDGYGIGFSWDLRVDVGNTDPRMLVRLRAIFGSGCIGANTTDKRPNRLPSWSIHWHGAKAARVLELIRPFLIIKCEQADIALASRAFVRHDKKANEHKARGMEEAHFALKGLKKKRPTLEEAESVIH